MKNQFVNMRHAQPKKKPEQENPDTSTTAYPPDANLKPTGSGLRPPLTNAQKHQPIQGNIYQTPKTTNSLGPAQQNLRANSPSAAQGFFPGRQPMTPGSLPGPGGFANQPPSSFAGPPGFPPAGLPPAGYQPNSPMPRPSGAAYFAGPNPPGFPPATPRPSGYQPNSSMPGSPNALQGPGYLQARMPGEMMYQQRNAPNFGPPPMRPNGAQNNRRKKRRFPTWARVLVATLGVILILGGGLYGYYQYNYADAVNSITGQQAIHHVNIAGSTPLTNQTNTGGTPTGGRVNILLLGSDDDGKNGNNGVGGAPLAQTDLVITIDPQANYVGELSIPRDLQVSIPGNSPGKMDFAFSYGYQAERSTDKILSTSSAAALAEDTIAYNYGIHIDYYAWVGLNGFVKVIDTANGVDIDVLHPIVDDIYPDDVNNPNNNAFDYKRLYIAPGPQHMTGTQALDYVRTRHADLGADFSRTVKQQQLLSQLKMKLATPDTITKAPALLADLKGFMQTDMTATQIIQMANLARSIDTNKIEHITFSPPTYSRAGLSGGNYAPVCDQIKAAVAKMFAVQPKCIPQLTLAAATSSSGPAVAMTSPTLQPQSVAPFTNTSWSFPKLSPGSITTNWNMAENFTGVHSLLDLMFMAVFGGFEAATV